MNISFRKIAKISLVLVYLVIVAGAVVRMTGSGMGCPDWPKCFGYYIPPTNAEELNWHPNKTYKTGQVIIKDEALLVAKNKFTTASRFNKNNWEPYTKHDYAVFNAAHTWTEYINRLMGALAGLATLIMGFASLSYWKKRKSVTILSWLVVFAMGFQAWLGATVVYSVLAPVKITLHMVMALVIVALILYIIYSTKASKTQFKITKQTAILLWFALGLTLVQIVLGTQVREFVDYQVKMVGDQAKELWLNNPDFSFYIHRSFSILVLLVNGYLWFINKKLTLGLNKLNWVLVLLGIEIITGMAMYYINFPFMSQPLHLVIASVLFGVQFYLLLEVKNAKVTTKTL